jgi:hypothetical protein
MIKKILLFFVALVLVDLVLGFLLRQLYFRQQSNPLFRTTYTLRHMDKEVVILGSSRANHHYTDSVFKKKLGKSYYNGGVDGEFFIYSYAMLYGIQKRYTPSLVVIDVNADALSGREFNTTGFSKLRPYYKEDTFFSALTSSFDAYEKIKSVSSLFPFNGKFFSIINGNLQRNDRDTVGYFPLEGSKDSLLFFKRQVSKTVDNNSELERIFEDCLKLAQKKGIKLALVISPVYERPAAADASLAKMKEITGKYKVPFLDYSTSPNFLGRKDLFYDQEHLNNKGAVLFSEELTEVLKPF